MGAFRVIPETGSPMAEMGMSEPSFAEVQSPSVITLFSEGIAELPVCASLRAFE
jgi:hypothetical protein